MAFDEPSKIFSPRSQSGRFLKVDSFFPYLFCYKVCPQLSYCNLPRLPGPTPAVQCRSREEERQTSLLHYLCGWGVSKKTFHSTKGISQSRPMPDMKLARDPNVTSSHFT